MKSPSSLEGRSLLSLRDISCEELVQLVDLAASLKQKKRGGTRGSELERKSIAMLVEKASTRTRCATSVTAADEGAHSDYLDAKGMHLGKKESVADTARVLGRMFDGIMFRGYKQQTVQTLAECSGVPVWNGLTDDCHPTQALADLLTVREHFGELKGLTLLYVGDGRNNVANSLMLGCAMAGMNFVNCTPEELMPATALVDAATAIAAGNGCEVTICSDPAGAAPGANVVYTDVWVSMGEEDKMDERLRLLRPYQVNMALMEKTGKLASDEVIFLHCLPAFHDADTDLTRESGALEVTDEVFGAGFSRVFDEAENRVHTIKALMVATLT